jgi:hypothetical protein
MIGFFIGLLLGGLCGVMTMALFQLGRRESEKEETEDTDNERTHTDD